MVLQRLLIGGCASLIKLLYQQTVRQLHQFHFLTHMKESHGCVHARKSASHDHDMFLGQSPGLNLLYLVQVVKTVYSSCLPKPFHRRKAGTGTGGNQEPVIRYPDTAVKFPPDWGFSACRTLHTVRLPVIPRIATGNNNLPRLCIQPGAAHPFIPVHPVLCLKIRLCKTDSFLVPDSAQVVVKDASGIDVFILGYQYDFRFRVMAPQFPHPVDSGRGCS